MPDKSENWRRRSEASKRSWQDPETRARRLSGLKAAMADPNVQRARIAKVKKTMNTPEFRKRRGLQGIRGELPEEERANYDVYRKAGYKQREALEAIGRLDLLNGPGKEE